MILTICGHWQTSKYSMEGMCSHTTWSALWYLQHYSLAVSRLIYVLSCTSFATIKSHWAFNYLSFFFFPAMLVGDVSRGKGISIPIVQHCRTGHTHIHSPPLQYSISQSKCNNSSSPSTTSVCTRELERVSHVSASKRSCSRKYSSY